MNFFYMIDNALNVKVKVILNVFLGILLTVTVLLYQMVEQNTKDLMGEAFSKLELARDIKLNQLKQYFHFRTQDVEVLAKSQGIIDITKDLIEVYKQLNVQSTEPYPVTNK